jgi:hypothetical protein
MKPSRILLVASVTIALVWGGYRVYRAHMNLVTLNVRNMELRRVVSKLEWQTWEHIVVGKSVGGRVTLNVHSVPLEEVLNIVGLQTDSRWTRLLPIYSNSKSLAKFNQVLTGNLPPAGSGWEGLQQLAAWQQAGLSGFASTLRAENKLVSAQLLDKDPAFAALALSRFSKAQIVPEDGTKGSLYLRLQQVSFEKAVAQMAKQLRRKWTQVYTLQPLNASVLVRKTDPMAAPNITDASAGTNQVTATSQEGPLPPERALEALVSTMTPEEREQTMEQISGASQAGSFSPGQRQPMMQSGSAPSPQAAQAAAAAQEDLESRIENRLKNGTIDQRLAHDRRVLNSSKQPATKP